MDVAKVRDKVASGRKRKGKARKCGKCDGSKIKNKGKREGTRANEQTTKKRDRERESEGDEKGPRGNTRAMRRDRMR